MNIADFDFDLPQELIAQHPAAVRSASRLLHLHCEPSGATANSTTNTTATISHHTFNQLPDLLSPDDLLVFNNTRVIPARMHGTRQTGGKVEVLIERILNKTDVLAQLRASKSPKAGSIITLDGGWQVEVTGREGDFFALRFPEPGASEIAELVGHVPLPPYIKRSDDDADKRRYQTVYAKRDGAVAAPTAGLHFDEPLLQAIASKGIHRAEVTLHVGAGTFQPVRVARLQDHRMHPEQVEVDERLCQAVASCRARGGRVVAVGTTSVRSLEAASASGELLPFQGDTDIFIYPGYRFRTVDALVTNFHLPGSTLLMLVSALAGLDHIKAAYNEAIHHSYRFFSYGDAMLITTGRATP